MAITDTFADVLTTRWQAALGAMWSQYDDQARPNAFYANTAIRRSEGNFPDNQYAQAKCMAIVVGDNSRGGVAVRMDAAGNCYYAILTGSGVNLYKRVAGVSSYITDAPWGVVSGTLYTVKLVATGTTLQVYINESLVITRTDSALAAGKPGLWAAMGGVYIFFDDFECTDAVAAGGGGGGGGGGGLLSRGGLLGVG